MAPACQKLFFSNTLLNLQGTDACEINIVDTASV